jgi:23S rRNA pseudouridine2605 synthase
MDRLNKVIAHAGIASRRKAEELILEGKVTVNGKVVRELATQVDPMVDKVAVMGTVIPSIRRVVYALNKPKGVITSTSRQNKEQIITDFVPPIPKVYPVGRLDKDSQGLILLTNDGDLSQRLTHPSYEHNKEYRVGCTWEKDAKRLDHEKIKKVLLKGVKLGDGDAKADKVDIHEAPNEGLTIYITVHEGRTHLIRRMCAVLGLEVRSLQRLKFATISLGNLKPGQYRQLTNSEQTNLR